jgi:hypothetical protein
MFRSVLLYLTALDSIPAAIQIILIPSIIIVALTIIIRRLYGYETLSRNNTLAGIMFGIVGLTYVMLLTFSTISVWDKFSMAQTAVVDEAAASRAIYTIAQGNTKEEMTIRDSVKHYLFIAVNRGWPSMAIEKESPDTKIALDNLYKAAVIYDRAGSHTTQVTSELFKHIDRINESRLRRTTLCKGIIPDLLWFILIAGAILTIGFTLFFGGDNIIVQASMTGMTSAIMLMALLVIISFDHPFTGDVSINSEPLQIALTDMHWSSP